MAKKEERKLSKAELKRKAEFEDLQARLIEEGYKEKELTMGTLAANTITFLCAVPFILILVLLYKVLNPETNWELGGMGISMFLLFLFLVLIVVHELIHGITWSLFTQSGFKAISFGFIVRYMTPYCTCKEPLRKFQMVLGCLMPTIVLGLVPGIVAAGIGSLPLLYLAGMMILGGSADIMITIRIMLYKSTAKEVMYYDHPYKIGTMVFER